MMPRLSTSYTPAITIGPDGAIDIVAIDTTGELIHCAAPDGIVDPSATRISGTSVFSGSPALLRRPDGGLDVFCRDMRGHVRHARRTSTGWSGWQTIGIMTRPASTCPGPGGLRAGHGVPTPSAGHKGDGRPPADVRVRAGISAAVCGDGHVELFASDLNRALWRSVEIAGVMAPWRRVDQPDLYTDVSVARGPAGPILVGASRDGAIWTGYVDGDDRSPETSPGWSRLEAHVTGAPNAWPTRHGYVISGRGPDAKPWHTCGNGYGEWSAWAPLPAAPLLPADVRVAGAPDTVGSATMCVKGVRGQIMQVRDIGAGGWTQWSMIGGPVVSNIGVASDPHGGVHVVGVGPEGRLVRIWTQTAEELQRPYEVALR